jgi:hypothetical protein
LQGKLLVSKQRPILFQIKMLQESIFPFKTEKKENERKNLKNLIKFYYQ